MTDLKIISEVVADNICAGCGTCAGVCPASALEMRETAGGLMIPYLAPSRCTECGLCDQVCPQLEMSTAMKPLLGDPFVGPALESHFAEATDPTVLVRGQTGGLARSWLAWLLESGRVDGVVCVVDDPERPLRPRALIAESPEEVLASSRSKYCPIPVNALISQMLRFEGRLAYVGVSCHMQGLQLALERMAKLRKKIVLRVGLFCGCVLTYQAVDFLLRYAGVRAEDVSAFEYRHRVRRDSVGDLRIETRNGAACDIPCNRRTSLNGLFIPIHCRLCIDRLNVLADCSIGDPLGIVRRPGGPTVAIVRTDTGRELLMAAAEAGAITLSPADTERIAQGQNSALHVHDSVVYGRHMLRRGNGLPVFLRTAPLAVSGKGRRPLWARWGIWIGMFSQTSRGIWVLQHVPRWAPVCWRTLYRGFKLWTARLGRVARDPRRAYQLFAGKIRGKH